MMDFKEIKQDGNLPKTSAVPTIKKHKSDSIPNIYVVDVETSGFSPYPYDVVFSIAISEVNIEKGLVKPVYNQVLGYDADKLPYEHQNAWIFENSPLSLDDVQKAYDDGQKASVVGKEVHLLLKDQFVAYYNKPFDYGNFIQYQPFFLKKEVIKNLPCLMRAATDPCAIPRKYYYGEYKFPTLQEAAERLLSKPTQDMILKSSNFHSPDYDTLVAGHIMLALIRLGHYNIFEYLEKLA